MLILDENPGSQNMAISARYLMQLVEGSLTMEPLPSLPMHANPPTDAELTLVRLACAPRSNRQLLPVATFSCNVKRWASKPKYVVLV